MWLVVLCLSAIWFLVLAALFRDYNRMPSYHSRSPFLVTVLGFALSFSFTFDESLVPCFLFLVPVRKKVKP